MHIIETLADLHALLEKEAVTAAMATYLEKELHLLRDSLEPGVPLTRFSLDIHGPIVMLSPGEESLADLGMRKSIHDLLFEWVSHKTIGGVEWYTIFFLADNDFMYQIYVPRDGLFPEFDEYLAEQAEEDERGEGSLPEGEPF